MKKRMSGIFSAVTVGVLLAAFFLQHRLLTGLREQNRSLQEQLARLTAANDQISHSSPPPSDARQLSDEQFRELLKLRNEVNTLRREQDRLLKQLGEKTTSTPAQPSETDQTWVQQVLSGPPSAKGFVAGTLRGKLLRREMTNVSPAELVLQGELAKAQLNQTLERSPAEFADFQAGFIQAALGISDPAKIQLMHEIIQQTYEQAVANGLDIPSKPTVTTDDWVQRRFQLDRAATARIQLLLTPDERSLFDRAFLGVMGVDLGGVGVDKSNYPKGFLGE
jgi:hypothetical protein